MDAATAEHLFYRTFDFQYDFPDIYKANQEAFDAISLECLLKIVFPDIQRENIPHESIALLQQCEKEFQENLNYLDNFHKHYYTNHQPP